jgi:circadian clock protein KaiC
MNNALEGFQPDIVVVDPVSNLAAAASELDVKSMLSRLIDCLKVKGITALCTDLTPAGGSLERTGVGISSLMDTWLLLQVMEGAGERNRGLYILKSRGMRHSNQIREFCLSDEGARLQDVYVGSGLVLSGAARTLQEKKEKAAALERGLAVERRQREVERKKSLIEARIAALRIEIEAELADLDWTMLRETVHQEALADEMLEMARARNSDQTPAPLKDAVTTALEAAL